MKGQIFKSIKNGIEIVVSTKRFEKQFDKAQYMLDEQIKIDTDRYVPMSSGGGYLAGSVNQLPSGEGVIEYSGPYARYDYYGKVMIGPAPKQVTDIDLNFDKTSHPNAGPFWFEESKAVNQVAWLNLVRKTAGGG